jgi:hypothetical protein
MASATMSIPMVIMATRNGFFVTRSATPFIRAAVFVLSRSSSMASVQAVPTK